MRRPIAWKGAAAIALAVAGGPAAAQQAAPVDRLPLPLGLPAPADTGKPLLLAVPPRVSAPSGCARIDCRVRVFGRVEHNGAVELNATVLKW